MSNEEVSNSSTNITILMPVRNGAHFIDQSLQNLISIARKNDEILIINDNSEDSTPRLLKYWAKEDTRIRVLNSKIGGLAPALNLGIKESQNDIIARADVDDRYHSSRLELQLKYITSESALIFSDYEFFTLKGKTLGVIPTAVVSSAMKLSLLNPQRVAHPSVMFLRAAVLEAGGYVPEDFPAEDLALWIRMSRLTNFRGIEQVLLKYSISKQSVSGSRRKSMIYKNRRLLSNFIPFTFGQDFTEFEEIFNDYKDFPRTQMRRLLLLRDLRTASNLDLNNKDLKETIRRISWKISKEIEAYPALASLGFDLAKRKTFRLGFTPKKQTA